MALIAYVALGALAYTTLSDTRIRGACLLILGLFAVKTWLRRKDVLHSEESGEPEAANEARRPTADGSFGPM
ncbi:MAG: hypothetical protein ACLQLC_02775 [Candidatus Sulfotelmatobacter sp.]